MCNWRRIARTSGTSTTCTRAPALAPRANAAASVRLSIRSLPNLLMPLSLPSIILFEPRRERLHLLLLVRRHVLPLRLGVDQQQEERHLRVMIEIDHPHAASFP